METRERLQPGVLKVLDAVPPGASVLDLGCGHGKVAEHLISRGHHGFYLGVDSSEPLLHLAREYRIPENFRFRKADLTAPEWSLQVRNTLPPDHPQSFLWILIFALLHHIPSEGSRGEFLQEVRAWLDPDGWVAISVWDFMGSERLRQRILPWSAVELSPDQVEEGDYLLDWRRGGLGMRYVHHFSEEELKDLAASAGYQISETFRSDGEGGRLGLYTLLRPRS